MNRSNNLQFLQVANRECFAYLSYTYNFVSNYVLSNYVLKNINLKGKFIVFCDIMTKYHLLTFPVNSYIYIISNSNILVCTSLYLFILINTYCCVLGK